MSFPLTTYPRALPDGDFNKDVTRTLEKLVDDTKAGISCAPLPFSLYHQGGSIGLNYFNTSKLKEQLGERQLFNIIGFSSTTHSSS